MTTMALPTAASADAAHGGAWDRALANARERASCPRCWRVSGTGADALAQQPFGPDHQHADEHDEGPHVLPRRAQRQVLGGHDLDQPQEEPPEHGTGDVADATQDSSREGLEAGDEAHVEVDLSEPQ